MSPQDLTDDSRPKRCFWDSTRWGSRRPCAPGYPDFSAGWTLAALRAWTCDAERRGGRIPAPCSKTFARSSSSPPFMGGTRKGNEPPRGPTHGRVLRYARGVDYHRVLWDKLEDLLDWLRAERPEVRGRAVVDTAPLLERDYARLAGLGWIGKNTMLISRRLGSFTFLGALLTSLELAYDRPHETNHCGSCTRCLDACPTNAFPGPYQLDARRCISYWTIEHRGILGDADAGDSTDGSSAATSARDVPWNRKGSIRSSQRVRGTA